MGWNQLVQKWVLWRALASGIMLGCTELGRQVVVLTKFYTLKVKVNFTIDKAAMAQRGSRGITLLFNLGAG